MKRVIESTRITSPFGYRKNPFTGAESFHNGVDIGAPIGTPIYAPFDGCVVASYNHPSGGKTLILRGENDDRAGFCHLNDILLTLGEKFSMGDMVARSGNTGRSTGAHLHFTYTPAEDVNWNASTSGVVKKWSDPEPYLEIK